MEVAAERRRAFLQGALCVHEAWRDDALELTGEAGGARVCARFVWRGDVGGWWRGPGEHELRAHPWALRAEVAESNVDRDLLGRFVSVLAGSLLGRPPRSRRHFPEPYGEFLAWADSLAKQLTEPFIPSSIEAAHRFPRGLRARLARRWTDDASGRLRQLVDCPGLVLLWQGLEASQDRVERSLAADFARGVVEGQRREAMLESTLGKVLAHRASAAATHVDHALRDAYRWRVENPGELDESRWPLLIRKASASVEPEALLRPPPLAYVPSDIPADRVENARWFLNMAMHDAVVNPTIAGSVEVSKAYGRLLSYVAAHETTGRFARREVLEWLRAAPQRPCRRWAPDGLYRRIRHPPQRRRPGVKPPAAVIGDRLGPFPPPPLPPLTGAGDFLGPLTTPHSVELEGEVMRHCAGGYVQAVFAGRSYLYAGVVAGERVTVEVVPRGEGWTLHQARGEGNRAPANEAIRRLSRWCPPPPESEEPFECS